MSSRSYLSIGDVLTLLRQEFPDVTISKIRFLESQGLVNPERTPSGYRKFYEHDVERLRWVLRQQREHFLPLKVIKDRLDDEGEDKTPSQAAEAGATAAASEEPVLVGRRTSTEVATAAGAASTGEVRAVDGPAAAPGGPGGQGGGSTLPGIESGGPVSNGSPATGATATSARGATPDPAPRKTSTGSRLSAPESPIGPGLSHDRGTAARPSNLGVGAQAPGPAVGSAPESAEPAPGSAPRRSRANPPTATAGRGGSPAGRSGTGASGPQASGAAEPPDQSNQSDLPDGSGSSAGAAGDLSSEELTAPRATRPKGRRTVPASSETAPDSPVPAGTSLSLEELAAASGLDPGVLQDLADFGLLAGTRVAGIVYFDDEGLAVAKIAAGFAQFGVEPRHLRLYKNAADREAGFVEQIVLPLVRQRNPEARARAHETVDELAHLGQQLRSSLLRSALGNLLDG